MGFLSRSPEALEKGLMPPPSRPPLLNPLRRQQTPILAANTDLAAGDHADPQEPQNIRAAVDGGVGFSGEGNNGSLSDGGKEKRCAQLRDQLRQVNVEFRSARQHAEEVRKLLAAQDLEVKRKSQEFLVITGAAAVSTYSSIRDIIKLRLPRDVVLPSDALSAWEAYDTARAEFFALRDERDSVEGTVERLAERLRSIRLEMENGGCRD
jgi:hypothetical protein